MKKFLALLLAIMMVLTLTACGSKTEEPTAGGDESNVTEITLPEIPLTAILVEKIKPTASKAPKVTS